MKRRKVSSIINIYSRKVKDQIIEVIKNFFAKHGIEEVEGSVFLCVDELIKNAIKANYKFILVLEKLYEKYRADQPGLVEEELHDQIKAVLRDKSSFDIIAPEIYREYSLVDSVRLTLNDEAKQLKIKDKAYMADRECTEEEIQALKQLKTLARVKSLLKKNEVKVLLKIEDDGEFVFIEVTNTAPITDIDLRRIHEKRDEFKQYRLEEREHEFFISHLDTSDSGFGLGYATIDSALAGIHMEPETSIQILAASDTTVILSFPIDTLKAQYGGVANAQA